MNKVTSWISALGQSIQFCAFFAHFGIAALVAEHVWCSHSLWILILIVVAAGIKEFYFDATYETAPKQTFTDNLEDFLGWTCGGFFGFGFAVGWW